MSKSFCFGSREPKKKKILLLLSLFCKKVCFVCSSFVFGRSFGDFSGYTFISRKTNRARAHTLHKSTSSSSPSEKNEQCHRVNHHFRVVFCDDHQKSSQIDDQQTRIIFVRRVVVVRIFSDWRKRRRRRK